MSVEQDCPEGDWQTLFPELAGGDENSRAVMGGARRVVLPAGQQVFHAGGACEHYLLILSGSVRVQVIGEGGREVLLYRVLPGQSCVLTTCCMLSGEGYPAEGFTEIPVTALVILKPAFDRAMESSHTFRRFVFANLGLRIAEVITRLEELNFRPVERRIATWLYTNRKATKPLQVTHHQLAIEVGTAREVVSRHLKRFESLGMVRLSRATVEVTNPEKLRRFIDP